MTTAPAHAWIARLPEIGHDVTRELDSAAARVAALRSQLEAAQAAYDAELARTTALVTANWPAHEIAAARGEAPAPVRAPETREQILARRAAENEARATRRIEFAKASAALDAAEEAYRAARQTARETARDGAHYDAITASARTAFESARAAYMALSR